MVKVAMLAATKPKIACKMILPVPGSRYAKAVLWYIKKIDKIHMNLNIQFYSIIKLDNQDIIN